MVRNQLMLYSDHILGRPLVVGLKLENGWCASLKLKIKLALMISKGGCSRIATPIAVDLFLLDAASI